MTGGRRILVIGGGYIGLEAAAEASKKGLEVTLIEAAERSGMDPSFAARQLLELVLERVEAGGDMMDALYEVRQALRQHSPAA